MHRKRGSVFAKKWRDVNGGLRLVEFVECLRLLNTKPNRIVPKGDNRKAAVVIISQTITASNAGDVFPANMSLVQEDIHRRAETITAVLSKIMEQPDALRRWGLNE